MDNTNISETSSTSSSGFASKVTPHHAWVEICWKNELQASREEENFKKKLEKLAPYFEAMKNLVPGLNKKSTDIEVCEMTVKYIDFIQNETCLGLDIEFLKSQIKTPKK